MSIFKKIAIISKKDDESVKDSLDTVIKYLDKKKIQYFFDENSSILLNKNNYSSIEAFIAQDEDIVVNTETMDYSERA